MEQSHGKDLTPFTESWIDVDTSIEYSGSTPTYVVFAYLENGERRCGVFAVEPDFDTNQIYGGLMAWTGRYDTVTNRLVAVQISNASAWYHFDTLDA